MFVLQLLDLFTFLAIPLGLASALFFPIRFVVIYELFECTLLKLLVLAVNVKHSMYILLKMGLPSQIAIVLAELASRHRPVTLTARDANKWTAQL